MAVFHTVINRWQPCASLLSTWKLGTVRHKSRVLVTMGVAFAICISGSECAARYLHARPHGLTTQLNRQLVCVVCGVSNACVTTNGILV